MHRSAQSMQTKDAHWGLFCNSENLETSANEFFKILKLWYIDTNQTIKKSCQDEKKKADVGFTVVTLAFPPMF